MITGLKGVNVFTVSIRRARGDEELNKKQLQADLTDPIQRKTNKESAITKSNSSHFRKLDKLPSQH